MDKLVLLTLMSIVYVCDAGLIQYNSNGFAISGSEESDEDPDNAPSCGRIMPSIEFRTEKRITSGRRDTKEMEFPWMVALFLPNTQPCSLSETQLDGNCWFYGCGGSLIGPKVVLSTGNCIFIYKQDKLKVRAGEWNMDTFEELLPYQERFVDKIIFHPQFQSAILTVDLLRNDVALLVVESPFTSADNIALICLPPPNLNVAPTGCKVAGWGKQSVTGTGHNPLLRVINLNYVNHDQCQRMIRQDDRYSSDVLHASFTCADGVLEQGTYLPDGGAPLICIADNHYYARGLASWGTDCGSSKLPHVYTDVVKARNWIDQVMRANGFTTDSYTPVAYELL